MQVTFSIIVLQASTYRYIALEDSEGRTPTSPLIPGFGLLQDGCRLGLARNVSIIGASIVLEFAEKQSMNGWYFLQDITDAGPVGYKTRSSHSVSQIQYADSFPHVEIPTRHYAAGRDDKAIHSMETYTAPARGSSLRTRSSSTGTNTNVTVARFRIEALDQHGVWTTVGAPAWTHSGGLQFFEQAKRAVTEHR
jgi:hypothetical protein